jgi:hypothetical protein
MDGHLDIVKFLHEIKNVDCSAKVAEYALDFRSSGVYDYLCEKNLKLFGNVFRIKRQPIQSLIPWTYH